MYTNMHRQFLVFLMTSLSFWFNSHGQSLQNNRDKIELAETDLGELIKDFHKNLISSDLDSIINNFANDKRFISSSEFHNYMLGNLLYDIQPNRSLEFHEKAYNINQQDINIILEYALELHRKQEFKKAAELYEQYLNEKSEDYRIHALLSDCYINQNEISKATESWFKADHRSHHTGIDFAIHMIYGRSDQIAIRSNFLKKIRAGDNSAFEDLIFLDLNWEIDWWNNSIQEIFLNYDISLAKSLLGVNSNRYALLQLYKEIKTSQKEISSGKFKELLKANHLILDEGRLPLPGKITSDILRICFDKDIIDKSKFLNKRGDDLLKLSKDNKDAEFLNIYAYLQGFVNKHVDSQIDKIGWVEMKDERFATSYFIGKKDKNKYDDPELIQAIKDFPNSASLQWIKTNCSRIENKEFKANLIESVKKEFKSLKSDQSRFSYQLNTFIYFLSQEN